MKDNSQSVIKWLLIFNVLLIFGLLMYSGGTLEYKQNQLSLLQEEKTRLEIEVLKYQLSIYKENEESLK